MRPWPRTVTQWTVLLLFVSLSKSLSGQERKVVEEPKTLDARVAGMEKHEGYFPFYWDRKTGKIWLEISRFEEEFLYLNALATGVGSNPIGLDRSQLGRDRVVRFQRVGPTVLLVERNLRYRAVSDNRAERRAVAESFAQSILWASQVAAESKDRVLVDLTDFLLRDVHDVIGRLRRTGQGTFKLDKMRSVVYLPRTKGFPRNTEFEAVLTFSSSQPGPLVSQVTPTPQALTIRQHQSFIQLPDERYQTRPFDPRAGSFGITYGDYAAPLGEPLEKHLIARHRLRKKNPEAALSEPVQPIVYYVDPGAPEPIRSALVEGAGWWSAAFESAGYRDAFRVEVLPPDVDPLDVRYNVIQWVHRSTRGWSYGSSVMDPRTGEILKGHVLLGSLRARQDRRLIEGLQPVFNANTYYGACSLGSGPGAEYLAPFDPKASPVQLALARIRQLAAHEVGHTLGFAHNFAASTYGRASVMDYPAPLVHVTSDGHLDLSEAYGIGIGSWDKLAVRYAYSDFSPDLRDAELKAILEEGGQNHLLFITDIDSRSLGSAHPLSSLWDNGPDPVAALEEAMKVRHLALEHFGEGNLPEGRPLSELSQTLVPVYLHHRYQVEAVAKMVGGFYYRYKIRGDQQPLQEPVPPQAQERALEAILRTIDPVELTLPELLLPSLLPTAFGYREGETFPRRTGRVFDPLSAAINAADISVSSLLQWERAARLELLHARDPRYPGLSLLLDKLLETWRSPTPESGWEAATARVIERTVLDRLLDLAGNERAADGVRAIAAAKLKELSDYLRAPREEGEVEAAHSQLALRDIEAFLNRPHPASQKPALPAPPPGSPIGGH